MKILLAQSAGFCFGVKRAITMAFEAADKHPSIVSLGPLIHSPQMVEKLVEKGVRVARSVDEATGDAVIIRSHGGAAEELQALEGRNLTIVDATCPFVKKAQEYAHELSSKKYFVVVVGEADHPEVQGIVSYAGKRVAVVANRDEAIALPVRGRIGVIAQTTQSMENYRAIVDALLDKGTDLRIFNTICDATAVRQDEARDIAAHADLVLVVGGFNSANTTRLAQLCRELQPRTYHIETAAQLEPAWFKGVETVGITAGASTPEWVIAEIVRSVENIEK